MTSPSAPDTVDDAPPRDVWTGRGRRFGRIGRVVPIAVLQIAGTLAVSRWSGGGGPGPWWSRASDGSAAGVVADPVVLGPVAVVLLVAGVVALPFRWRWPVVVLGIVLVTTVAFALTVSPRGPFVAALTMAIVNAWFRGHRVPVLVAAVVAVVLLPWSDVLTGRSPVLPWATTLLAVAWLTATIAVTELVRVRTDRIAERRRASAAEARRRADDERVRIARELHDSVAHNMSLINLQAGVALHLGDDLPLQTRDALTNIRDASRDALVELRTVLGVLRSVDGAGGPADRNPTPGLDRLPDLVDRARAAGVDVTLVLDGDVTRVAAAVDRSAFRIVQEGITNVMKHAPGHGAVVTVDVGAEVLDLVVEDRPDPGAVRRAAPVGIGDSGNGIIGMRERATAVGGTFTAGPQPDGSWRVEARLPIGTPDAVPGPVGVDGPAARTASDPTSGSASGTPRTGPGAAS